MQESVVARWKVRPHPKAYCHTGLGLTLSLTRADVIVNSVCSGLVYTDIARSIVSSSALMNVVLTLYLGRLGKSADYGAGFYVTSALTSQD
jgi:hypothetical protein